MGKIVVTEFVSLDGVMEDPGGGESYKHGGWTFQINRGEEGDTFKLAEIREADAQLLRLMVFPVVLGSGKRLFGETTDKKPLRLADSKIVGDGIAIQIYERA